MTDPTDRRAELEARNAAMREQVESLLGGLNRKTEQLQQAQADAMAATGEATSRDGLVTANVNAAGIVTDLTLSDTSFTRSTPEKLAHSIVATIQSAAQDARGKADAALAPMREDVPDLSDIVPGAPSIKDLVPAPPEPPRTPAEPEAPQAKADRPDEWDDYEDRSIYEKDQW